MFNQYQDIMSVFDVAEALYIGKNRVYELLESDELKGFRIGRVWKIPRSSVEQYVLQQSGLTNPIYNNSMLAGKNK